MSEAPLAIRSYPGAGRELVFSPAIACDRSGHWRAGFQTAVDLPTAAVTGRGGMTAARCVLLGCERAHLLNVCGRAKPDVRKGSSLQRLTPTRRWTFYGTRRWAMVTRAERPVQRRSKNTVNLTFDCTQGVWYVYLLKVPGDYLCLKESATFCMYSFRPPM
ncbi:hypothetical protein PGTUg99_030195 [Puccinia graminis f. sp. tritici]|uniref:Uncharacterized protein n=1 Tax=Puccinia graminis f. sp. tritici TaxID=56615 RepID=A0A5B0RAF3_PUCGR|nr:hypothetical protein PGTUg99_030195 [Puccinia graminis f. sp. tritici]